MAPSPSEKLIIKLLAYCGDGIGEFRGRRAEVAKALNVTRSNVDAWLLGKQSPNYDVGKALEAFLKRK